MMAAKVSGRSRAGHLEETGEPGGTGPSRAFQTLTKLDASGNPTPEEFHYAYDAHGNNVASLSRNGLGYNVLNRRSFDAWGSVRLGAPNGDPAGRYCANLGHKQDDESGLVYMRARYYEPTSGRFVSEDPGTDGLNWFAYCGSQPTSRVDRTGKKFGWPWTPIVWGGFLWDMVSELSQEFASRKGPDIWYACVKVGNSYQKACITSWAISAIKATYARMVDGMTAAAATGEGSIAEWAIVLEGMHTILLILAIDAIDLVGSDALIDSMFGRGQ